MAPQKYPLSRKIVGAAQAGGGLRVTRLFERQERLSKVETLSERWPSLDSVVGWRSVLRCAAGGLVSVLGAVHVCDDSLAQ